MLLKETKITALVRSALQNTAPNFQFIHDEVTRGNRPAPKLTHSSQYVKSINIQHSHTFWQMNPRSQILKNQDI